MSDQITKTGIHLETESFCVELVSDDFEGKFTYNRTSESFEYIVDSYEPLNPGQLRILQETIGELNERIKRAGF